MNENRLKKLRADDPAYAGMIRYFDTKKVNELSWNFEI